MARHSTAPLPAARPASSPSGATLITIAVVLGISLVAVALILTGSAEGAQGMVGSSLFFGLVALLTRKWWG